MGTYPRPRRVLTREGTEVTEIYVPELAPVSERPAHLMTRPWLDWCRHVAGFIQHGGSNGGGGTGTGDVTGPSTSTNDAIAVYNGTTGKIIKDSLKTIAGLTTDITNSILPGGTLPVGDLPAHHTLHEPGGSDAMAIDAAAATGSLRTIGTTATSACAGNDARLTDARTPTLHQATHRNGGSDPLPVTALSGYPGGTSSFLRADGTFAAPAGAGDVVGPTGATADAIAVYSGTTGKLIKDSAKTIATVVSDSVSASTAAILPGGMLPASNLPIPGVVTISSTPGTYDVVLPSPRPFYYVECNPFGGDITLRTMTIGRQGDTVLIENLSNTNNVWLSHAVATPLTGFNNRVTSGATPLGPKGSAMYVAAGGFWFLSQHNQGGAIRVPYSAANYSVNYLSGTWTVESGDIKSHDYQLVGNVLFVTFTALQTSVGGPTPIVLRAAGLPFTSATGEAYTPGLVEDSAGAWHTVLVYGSGVGINIQLPNFTPFPASTNGTNVSAQVQFVVS